MYESVEELTISHNLWHRSESEMDDGESDKGCVTRTLQISPHEQTLDIYEI